MAPRRVRGRRECPERRSRRGPYVTLSRPLSRSSTTMAAKLKTLKVAELKEILSAAAVHHPPRANKSDLIAKIIASPAALNAFNAIHAPERVSTQKSEQPLQNDDLVRVFTVSSFV